MRKNFLIFSSVTAVALLAATLGHRFCPAFCMTFKPMAWPFVCLVALVVKSLAKAKKDR